jgi:methylenetetrahydrofolate dehydrogenase (NADP+)/methenyltetrahydrofolate cyclohydrolase
MPAQLLDGKTMAAEIRGEVAKDVAELRAKGVPPGLGVVLVGDDPGSQLYVRNKHKDCAEAGIESFSHEFDSSVSEERLLGVVGELNADPRVHAFLVQAPLPEHIDERKVINAIDPNKDADGFHPVNVGRTLIGEPGFAPCTPYGIQVLLQRSGVEIEGKHVVIINRSNIVGKPLAALLIQKAPAANATVTICHSRTPDIPAFTRQADIVVTAVGRVAYLTPDMIQEGAVVVDVSMNRIADASRKSGYRFVGDCDYEAVAEKAGAITPVPGGVGPMTRAMLLVNTVEAARRTLA